MNKIDVKIVITRRPLKWSFRPTFSRTKQFHSGATAIEK